MTYADRIRAMTDEELAEYLAKIMTYCGVSVRDGCSKNCPMYKCCNDQASDNIEDWLKQEADNEDQT